VTLPAGNYGGLGGIRSALDALFAANPKLNGKVSADVDDGKLLLRLASGNAASLTLKAAATDPAVTVLGFASNQAGVAVLNNYDDLEEVVNAIPTLPGLSGTVLDYTGKVLTVKLQLAGLYADRKVTPEFVTTLGELSEIEGAGKVTLKVEPTLSFTLGFDFNARTTPELLAGFTPSDGRLTAPANFSIRLNAGYSGPIFSGLPVPVTVPVDPTNTSVADLVEDFNTAIEATLLNGYVEARATSGGRIVLAVVNHDLDGDGRVDVAEDKPQGSNPADGRLDFKEDKNANDVLDAGEDLDGDGFLDVDEDVDGDGGLDVAESSGGQLGTVFKMELLAAANDPTVTELQFTAGSPVYSRTRGLFLDEYDSTTKLVTGTITYSGSEVDATATLAEFIELTTEDGTASGQVRFSAHLQDPLSTTTTPDHRLTSTKLFTYLGALDRIVASSAITTEETVTLTLSNIKGQGLCNDALPPQEEVTIAVPDIADLVDEDGNIVFTAGVASSLTIPDAGDGSGYYVTYPDVGLFALREFRLGSLVTQLENFVAQIEAVDSYGLLGKKLPFIDRSVTELVDFAGRLNKIATALRSNPGIALAAAEDLIEAELDLDDDEFEFCLADTPNPKLSDGADEADAEPATAIFDAPGANNSLFFEAKTAGAAGNGIEIKFVDDGTVTVSAPDPVVSYDADTRVLLIKFDATRTTAEAIRDAVNDYTESPVTADYQGDDEDTAFGAPGSGAVTKTALNVTFRFSESKVSVEPFRFNAAELVAELPDSALKDALSGLTDILQVEGGGTIAVEVGGSLVLDFGLDITDWRRPSPFLGDATSLDFTARVVGTGLNLKVGSGLVGFFIRSGTLLIDADGQPGTTDPAHLTFALENDDGNGRHYFRDSFREENVEVTFTAGAAATLPLYAPTAFTPLGGTGDVEPLDGFTDNLLIVKIPDLKRIGQHYLAEAPDFDSVTIRPVGLNNDFTIGGLTPGTEVKFLHAKVTTPTVAYDLDSNVVITMRDRFTTAAQLKTALDGFGLPTEFADGDDGTGKVNVPVLFVAPDFSNIFSSIDACDLFAHAGVFVDGLDRLLGKVEDGIRELAQQFRLPVVGSDIGDALAIIQSYRAGLIDNLQVALAEVGGDAIGLVKKVIFDTLGKGPDGLDLLVDADDPEQSIDRWEDVDVTCNDNQITFKLRLAQSLGLIDTTANPIAFDLGWPALGLEVDGNVIVEAGYDLLLHFGLNPTQGFFVYTEHDDPELSIELNATIPGLHASGRLGLLQLDVEDDDENPTELSASFTVDIRDPNDDDDKLTFADLTSGGVKFGDIFVATAEVEAHVLLNLVASFRGNAGLPAFATDFALDWSYTRSTDDAATPPAFLEAAEPPAEVGLTIEFRNVRIDLGSLLGDLVRPVLEEIREVTRPLDPLIALLDARLPVLSDLAGEDVTLLQIATQSGFVSTGAAQFINQVINIKSLIDDYDLSGASIEIPLGSFQLIGGDDTDAGEIDAEPEADVDLDEGETDAGVLGFLKKLTEGTNFVLPWVENPSSLFPLFLGQPVSLVEYRLPVLEFGFSFSRSFPIFPPLNAVVAGEIGAKIDLTFGFDTLGVHEFFATGERDARTLLDGFYVRDLDDLGEDVPELSLTGNLLAGASIGGFGIEAGVVGGIFAGVDFNLHDPDADGRVRLRELAANAREDLRCIFDITGRIEAGLEAYVRAFGYEKEKRLATVVLFEFAIDCPEVVLGSLDGTGALTMHVGTNAGRRADDGWRGDSSDGAESFTVEHLEGSAGAEKVRVSWNGYVQDFEGVARVLALAGVGDDTIDATTLLSPTELHGGDGTDRLLGGRGANALHGDAGSDTLVGGPLTDVLTGGDGADSLDGGEGEDTLRGDAGADVLAGGRGNDVLDGGDGTDELDGADGDDRLVGGLGDDVLRGGAGADVLVGDLGTISGPLSVTGISGAGRDLLVGGPGLDVIFGGGGDDAIFGGTLFANGASALTDADAGDFIDGGEGDDTILTDDGTANVGQASLGIALGGVVWFDAENAVGLLDDVRGSGESGIAGVIVRLLNVSDSSLVATTATAADGSYRFTGFAAGDYVVEFARPLALSFAAADAGTDDTLDSDAHVVTGRTAPVTLAAGDQVTHLDAGLFGPVVISVSGGSVTEGQNGRTQMLFTVSLSAPSARTVTVCYTTQDVPGGAVAGEDYTVAASTLTFLPGETMKTVAIDILGDRFDEAHETFRLRLDHPRNAQLDDPAGGEVFATARILDDDAEPTITIGDGVATGVQTETSALEFFVRLSNPSSRRIEVPFATGGLTGPDAATSGADFVAQTGTLVFLPGETEKTITVAMPADAFDELDERFAVLLGAVETFTGSTVTPDLIAAASIVRGTGYGTILDDDATPKVSIGNGFTVVEGHGGAATLNFTLTLSAVSGKDVTVDWATARGTAADGIDGIESADFLSAAGSETFPAGTTALVRTVTIPLAVLGDRRDEPFDATILLHEYFFLNAIAADNATIEANHCVVQIFNDDTGAATDVGPWALSFTQPKYSVVEGETLAEIGVLRAPGSSYPFGVFYTTDGTATAGTDYDRVQRFIVPFAPGEDFATVLVPIRDDLLVEGDETVRLHLRNPAGGQVTGGIADAALTIRDNEPLPTLAVTDATTTEGAGATFTVWLTLAPGTTLAPAYSVAVPYTIVAGSALATFDYTVPTTTVTFSAALPGPHTIVVPTVNDSTAEFAETFTLHLANPAGTALFADAQGLGTILDNDTTTILGRVFLDVNGNGVFDDGDDRTLPGVTVRLDDGASPAFVAASTIFGGDPNFYIGAVQMGAVRVVVDETTLPEGLLLSTGNSPLTVAVGAANQLVADIGFRPGTRLAVPGTSLASGGTPIDDTAYGGAGTDLLDGGGGDDTLVGGSWLGPDWACTDIAYDVHLALGAGDSFAFVPFTATQVQFDQTAYVVNEKAGTVSVTLVRPVGWLQSSVVLTVANGTATNGEDFASPIRRLVSFLPGETSKTVTLAITPDAITEPIETLRLSLRTPTGLLLTGAQTAVDVHIVEDHLCPDDDVLFGQDGDDDLLGDHGYFTAPHVPVLFGGRGDDLLLGGEGADFLHGAAGADRLEGAGGDDLLLGGEGDDAYLFDAGLDLGFDTITEQFGANGGIDTLDFSPTLTARVGGDLLAILMSVTDDLTLAIQGDNSTTENDVIENVIGGSLDDALSGNRLDNVLTGGPGSDRYRFDQAAGGSDLIVEEPGELGGAGDVVDFSQLTTGITFALGLAVPQSVFGTLVLTLSSDSALEQLFGGLGNDTLIGNSLDNVLRGGAGADTLIGMAGDDRYLIDADTDLGSHTILEFAGGGTDTLDFSASTVAVAFDLGLTTGQTVAPGVLLTLVAGDGLENLIGGDGNDVLTGNDLDNLLTGGLGNDTITGGLGVDRLVERRNADVFALTDSSLVLNFFTPVSTETDSLAGIEQAALIGGDGDNIIDASTFTLGSVWLEGGAGDDTLLGGGDQDFLIGGADDDTLDGGGGDDTYRFDTDEALGTDTILASAGSDTLDFAATSEVAIVVDLGVTAAQSVNAHLQLILAAGAARNVIGGERDDILTGDAAANVLFGGDGNDTLFGGLDAVTDTLDGGAGFDKVALIVDSDVTLTDTALTIAGGAADTIVSIETADLTGGLGINELDASAFTLGPVRLDGAGGNDTLRGGSKDDTLIGGDGDDVLEGGGGDDVLEGGADHDTLRGGTGHDTYRFDADSVLGADTLDDVSGSDTLDYSATTTQAISIELGAVGAQSVALFHTLSLMSASAIEHAIGGALGDTLTGNALDNTLTGGAGDDVLTGGFGDDTLLGGAGDDRYVFDASLTFGADGIEENANPADGRDTVDFSLTPATTNVAFDLAMGGVVQTVGAGTITLLTCEAIENLIGGAGHDTLSGNTLANVLTGGAGDDTLTGRFGDDTYLIDADTDTGADLIVEGSAGGEDTISFAPSTVAVTVNLGVTVPQVVAPGVIVTLSANNVFENLIGGSGDDTLTGNSLNNRLAGGPENDTYRFDVDQVLGTDTIDETGGGSDTLDFSATTSVGLSVDLGLATQTVTPRRLVLVFTSADSLENLVGGDLNPLDPTIISNLTGNSGGNRLTYVGGAANLIGGFGDDTYAFNLDLPIGTVGILDVNGNDTLDFSATLTTNITGLTGDLTNPAYANQFENIVGGAGHDVLSGRGNSNRLEGGPGNDTLNGRGLNDVLIGGLGDDTYLFEGAWSVDTIVELAGEGLDTASFSSITADLTFTVNAALSVVSGVNSVSHAGAFVENLLGGSGADTFLLTPPLTAFTVAGGFGADTLNFDAQGLTVSQVPAGTITAIGYPTVTHSGFETVNILNPPPSLELTGGTSRVLWPSLDYGTMRSAKFVNILDYLIKFPRRR
jgi:Ca2+-binding RTX toxin-like protein